MQKYRVAKTHEIKSDRIYPVQAGNVEMILVRVAGRVRALVAHCSHHGAPMADGLLGA